MADFQAIGGVSATLLTLLRDRMELPDHIPTAPVTTGPPPFAPQDQTPPKEDVEQSRLNLFLYRVTENGYLQNQEIPGRGSAGAYGHPPLSLNLHYLLTSYGATEAASHKGLFDNTDAQFLLGSAMRVLHDVPIVTENLVTVRPVSGRSILHESLRHEFERVKLTLEPLTLEDVTKVWTALGLRYRLSAAYVVNVVQIESRRQRTFPKPVGQPLSPTVPPLPTDPPSPGPMVYALPIQTPTITSVSVRRAGVTVVQPYPYAAINDTLILRGTSLAGAITRVEFGDLFVTPAVVHGDVVEVVIPDHPQLQPGARTVRVVVSDPLVPRSAFRSNDAAFMLVPSISALAYAAATRRLTISGTRLIGPVPGGETVIGRSVVAFEDYTTAPAATPLQIVLPLPDALPANNVRALIGAGLTTDPIVPQGHSLDITVGATTRTATASFASPSPAIAVAEAAAFVAGLIHDAGAATPASGIAAAVPPVPALLGAKAAMWRDGAAQGLVIVPGGLTSAMQIASSDAFDQELGLDTARAVSNGVISGGLASPPPLTSRRPRLTLTMGGQPAVTLTLSIPATLAALAADLQAQIRAAGAGAIFTKTLVVTIGSQLLLLPGAAGPAGSAVTFGPAPDDSTTVEELQLQGSFPVRVRVNGAESIDTSAVVRLPQ
jgi:hypothetical protein